MVSFCCFPLVLVIVVFTIDNAFSRSTKENDCLETLKEKWRTAFEMGDIDNDGIFNVDDTLTFIQKIITNCNASEELIPGLMEFYWLHIEIRDAYFGEESRKTELTIAEWVESYGWYWISNSDDMKQRLHAFFTAVFHAIDTDDDGVVNFQEFEPYYKQFGTSDVVKDKTRKAFMHIDADGNGVISEEEFRDIYLKFYMDPVMTAKELPVLQSKK